MKTEKLFILKHELELLRTHLLKSNLSPFNKKKLNDELESAKIMTEQDLPGDVVCLNSEVRIQEVEEGKIYNFKLVLPNEADITKNKVSVFAPLGIALLGYKKGALVQWEMPKGLKTFKILAVIQRRAEKSVQRVDQ